MSATIRRVSRPRGELTPAQIRRLERAAVKREAGEAEYRTEVLDALAESSFSAVSQATGLSTNTLQRWKREAGK
jgi:hypothetical protein